MDPLRRTPFSSILRSLASLSLLGAVLGGCAGAPNAAPSAAAPAPQTPVAETSSVRGGYAAHPAAGQFIEDMATRHGLPRDEVTALLARAQRQQSILDAISRPAEAKPWRDYRPIFLTPARIDGGVQFWNTNAQILADAEREFGVDARVIVAIVGVETRYGGNTGKYRVLDALCTLGFDYPKRADFFRKELEEFLLLTR